MKNIALGLIFTLVCLPQVSFGAPTPPAGGNPPSFRNFGAASCDRLDDESRHFFDMQAKERGDFGKANPDSMTKHDRHFKALLTIDMARRSGKSTTGLPNPPDEDSAFTAFQAKQLNDKIAFLQHLAQERQTCSNSPTTAASTPAA